MKKFLLSIISIIILTCTTVKAEPAKYEEFINQSKPCIILIYADWADDVQTALNAYENLSKTQAKKYNFAKINICKEEAKEFNKKNYIYPGIPYAILYKNKGRISRVITNDCFNNSSCINEKMNLFAQ